MTPDPKKINEALRAHRKKPACASNLSHIEALLRKVLEFMRYGTHDDTCEIKFCGPNCLCANRLASTISQCLEGLE